MDNGWQTRMCNGMQGESNLGVCISLLDQWLWKSLVTLVQYWMNMHSKYPVYPDRFMLSTKMINDNVGLNRQILLVLSWMISKHTHKCWILLLKIGQQDKSQTSWRAFLFPCSSACIPQGTGERWTFMLSTKCHQKGICNTETGQLWESHSQMIMADSCWYKLSHAKKIYASMHGIMCHKKPWIIREPDSSKFCCFQERPIVHHRKSHYMNH